MGIQLIFLDAALGAEARGDIVWIIDAQMGDGLGGAAVRAYLTNLAEFSDAEGFRLVVFELGIRIDFRQAYAWAVFFGHEDAHAATFTKSCTNGLGYAGRSVIATVIGVVTQFAQKLSQAQPYLGHAGIGCVGGTCFDHGSRGFEALVIHLEGHYDDRFRFEAHIHRTVDVDLLLDEVAFHVSGHGNFGGVYEAFIIGGDAYQIGAEHLCCLLDGISSLGRIVEFIALFGNIEAILAAVRETGACLAVHGQGCKFAGRGGDMHAAIEGASCSGDISAH